MGNIILIEGGREYEGPPHTTDTSVIGLSLDAGFDWRNASARARLLFSELYAWTKQPAKDTLHRDL